MNKQKNVVTVVLLVGIVTLVAVWFFFNQDSISNASESNGSNIDNSLFEVHENDIVKGNPNAKIIIIEYADFTCPACGLMNKKWQTVWRLVKNDILLVYRQFPLLHHKHSMRLSQYAIAANKQGKFWEFHDLVYDSVDIWINSSKEEGIKLFDSYIVQIGLDVNQFQKDIKKEEINEKIANDIEIGEKSRVRGTPWIFMNGKQISIPNDLSEFISLIKNTVKEN